MSFTFNSVLCVSEDRRDCELPLWLLLASIRRHYPGAQPFSVRLFLPKASENLLNAIADLDLSDCEIVLDYASAERSWDVKPAVLERCLQDFDEVLWIDSDIILYGRLDDFFPSRLDPFVILGTEEPAIAPYQGTHFRTRPLGLKLARHLKRTMNSGIIRVTKRHLPLLGAWKCHLRGEVYAKEQRITTMKRWVHLLSDQDLLTGILGSDKFADIPVRLLRSDSEIIQIYGPAGYTVCGRIMSRMRPTACAIHAMAKKPWHHQSSPGFLRNPSQWYAALCSELSPYTIHAQTYVLPLALADRSDWLCRKTLFGHIFKTLAVRDPAGSGIALAAIDGAVRRVKRIFKMPFRAKELP